jgi:glycosyltransferase involved in cell wall biosynthesis
MRVVYYSRPPYFDTFLPKIEALSKKVELHVILEISPESWQSGLFDVSKQLIGAGVHEGVGFLDHFFVPALHKYWQRCASVSIVVHTHPKSIHPKAWWISHQVMNRIEKLHPDVFHLDDISLRLAPMLFELKEVPLVLNIHDAQAHSGEHNWRTDLARWLSFGRTRHFILHSNFSRNQFLKRYAIPETRVTMIPLGILDIYRDWVTSEIPEERKTVLFFGRISPYKGVEVFIKAAELVSDLMPGCRFVIAGRAINGYSLPELPQLSQGNVFEIYQQYLSNTQVANLVSRSSLVACPYLDASQSGVILTAYAFNKPVIATNVGGLSEYVWEGKTGSIVAANDPEALAKAIINMLGDRAGQYFSRSAFEALRNDELNWGKIAEKTLKVYEKILE